MSGREITCAKCGSREDILPLRKVKPGGLTWFTPSDSDFTVKEPTFERICRKCGESIGAAVRIYNKLAFDDAAKNGVATMESGYKDPHPEIPEQYARHLRAAALESAVIEAAIKWHDGKLSDRTDEELYAAVEKLIAARKGLYD